MAFDLVNEHFRLLQEVIVSERGAIVKTIGDAVAWGRASRAMQRMAPIEV